MKLTVPILPDRSGPDLTGLPEPVSYTINADGESYALTMPPDWREPGVLTRLEMVRRLTMEERIAARQSSDPIIADWMHLLDLAEDVRLDDPDTVAAVHYLESQGIIAPGRAEEILTP